MRRELIAKLKRRHGGRTGDKRTPEYICWRDLRRRYPGLVTRRWWAENGKGFVNFLCDVGQRPSNAHRLVRLDPKKIWSKANCQWLTSQKRVGVPRVWVKRGRRMVTLSEAAQDAGIKYDTLWARLKRGWPLKRALEQ